MTRALLYARVSLDASGTGRSVDEQERECRAWAEREGWTITAVVKETGSASRYARSTQARTRWAEVTDAIASGDFDILLTWEASRATRDLTAYTALRELCAKHRVLWGYSGTVYDLTKRDARFRTGLDALLSEDESGRLSERVSRSVRARASEGLPHGKIPYGFRREYDPTTGTLLRQVPDDTTAPIVREIFTRIADGEPQYSIAVDLTRRAVPIPRPALAPRRNGDEAKWIPRSVRRIATNPIYAGWRTHAGQIVSEASWPAIVDQDLFDRAQGALATTVNHNPHGDSAAKHLLSGVARCGVCGGPMRRIKNRGTPSYTCWWCHRVSRAIEPVDEHVSERVAELLAAVADSITDDNRRGSRTDLETARAEVVALQTRLEGFTDSAADGNLTPAALARIESKLLPQIAAARRRVQVLAAPAKLQRYNLTDPHALWEAMTMEERRQLLRELFTVTVYPAGRGRRTFDPALVEVLPTW